MEEQLELLRKNIEALIFASEKGIAIEDLETLFSELEMPVQLEHIEDAINQIAEYYNHEDRVFELQEINGHFLFMTKQSYHEVVQRLIKQKQRKKLSKAAVETLAIIAYKQPVSKAELEQIRGVSCDYSIQKLLEKELIAITGRSEGPGRPILYGTSEKFMDHFGLKSIADLPKLSDIESMANEIGKQEIIAEQALQNSSDN